MWVRGQGLEVLRDGLEMGNLCQHGYLFIHYRLQQGYKTAKSLSLLDESLPQSLLLCFFQKDVFITHILHRTVQLGLEITTAFLRFFLKF